MNWNRQIAYSAVNRILCVVWGGDMMTPGHMKLRHPKEVKTKMHQTISVTLDLGECMFWWPTLRLHSFLHFLPYSVVFSLLLKLYYNKKNSLKSTTQCILAYTARASNKHMRYFLNGPLYLILIERLNQVCGCFFFNWLCIY